MPRERRIHRVLPRLCDGRSTGLSAVGEHHFAVTPKGTLMRINAQTTSGDVVDTSFTIDGVPGVLWSPVGAAGPTPLVLMGHPGGLHKRAPGMVARAVQLVTAYGLHAAAIDAPGHGERAPSDADTAWIQRMQRARAAREPLGPIVSAYNALLAEQAVPEWQAAMDALLALPGIDDSRPVGYSGMTLATEIGLRLAAADPRIGALGVGAAFASDGLQEIASRVTAPTLYLLPWDDAEIDRASGIALWDALGAEVKALHVFPGPHERVPVSEADDFARFVAAHLQERHPGTAAP